MSVEELTPAVDTPSVRKVPVGRTRVIGVIIVVIGLFSLIALGLNTSSRAHSALTFSPVDILTNAPWHLGTLTLLTFWTNVILGLIMIGVGFEVLWRQPRRGVMGRFGFISVLFLLALLFWAVRTPGPSQVSFIDLTSILVGSSEVTMVLIFGSLSGVMCERAGVVNIAIEGQFIAGAFVGASIASTTSNYFYAAIGGLVAGGIIGWILAFLAVRYRSDQIIVGVVLVTMLSGLSSYLNLQIFTPYPKLNTGNVLGNFAIPLLDKIPIIGPVFFNQSAFFYLMLLLIGGVSFALFKTRYGLHVRAVGEHPHAAATVGINVARVRYINVVLGGAIAGVGGVAFISQQGQFQPGITSGLGYIALAAMIFGRWRPSGAVVACVLFGMSVYLADNLQTYNIPISTEILTMFPYIITIFVVSGLVGRVRAPAADGLPYQAG
jgi:simple sugar transport system permease protein